jgi:hypothetical protein
VTSFTCNGLQKKIDPVERCCREWRLKCNLNKSKVIVIKNGEEIEDYCKMEDGWTKYGVFR